MAKKIKAIKCPQCGSNQNTQLKEDQFRCKSCGTEYFLDSDDININVRHSYDTPSYSSNPADKKKILYILAGVGLFFGLMIFMPLCGILFRSGSSITDVKNYHDSYRLDFPVNVGGTPHVVAVGTRSYTGIAKEDGRNGAYVTFINLKNGKTVKATQIPNIKEINRTDQRRFSNGKYYLVLNERFIFEVNIAAMTVADVTVSMFANHTDFDSGIAKASFVYSGRGEGFNIMTNTGKEFYFYPLADLAIPEKSFWSYGEGFNTLRIGWRDSTYYCFTKKPTIDYNVERIPQLLKVLYAYNAGGPEYKQTSPEWNRNWTHSKYEFSLFRSGNRVRQWTDLTPERIYFEPKVIYYSDSDLLIAYKPTPATDAVTNLQRLNPETGAILWTLPLESAERRERISEYDVTVKCGNTYVIRTSNQRYMLLREDGVVEKEYNLRD